MQFSKFLSLFCATAVCAGFISARADDNPAQAAARAALEQKMQDLDAQEAATNSAAPPAVVVTPSGAAQEQPAPPATVTTTPAATETQSPATAPAETQPAPAIIPADNDAQAAARAALNQKMQELDEQEAATNSVTLPVITIAPVVAAPEQTSHPVETQPAPTAQVQAPAAAPTPTPSAADVNYPGKELGLKPIEAPAPPISADKQAQLQALLAKYMADQVSPEEYQQQRAAILAQP
jgi:hypothetical protein